MSEKDQLTLEQKKQICENSFKFGFSRIETAATYQVTYEYISEIVKNRHKILQQPNLSPEPTINDVAEKIILMMMKEFHSGKNKGKSIPFALGNLKAYKACFKLLNASID